MPDAHHEWNDRINNIREPAQEKDPDGIMVPNNENDKQHQDERQQMDIRPGMLSGLHIDNDNGYELRKCNTLQKRNDGKVDGRKVIADKFRLLTHCLS